jgi:recombinational DNA repair protein (RecF pathway)
MREIVGQGLVLRRDDLGEFNERITFFTREWGKLKGKTISSRKPLSKLSPHLDIGNIVRFRCVEKHELQLVDALKMAITDFSLFDLNALDRLLFEDEIDEDLWDILVKGNNSWEEVLSHLGWDKQYASCVTCSEKRVTAFDLGKQSYACEKCSGYLRGDDRLLLEVNRFVS